jgi:hypothetical protein
MPVVFKGETKKPVVIDKDGTLFHFVQSRGKQMQSMLSAWLNGEDVSAALWKQFKLSLVKWENLQDSNGNEIEYSAAVRDALIEEGNVFSLDDVFMILFDEDIRTAGKKKLTSQSASEKPLSGDGLPTNAENATGNQDA